VKDEKRKNGHEKKLWESVEKKRGKGHDWEDFEVGHWWPSAREKKGWTGKGEEELGDDKTPADRGKGRLRTYFQEKWGFATLAGGGETIEPKVKANSSGKAKVGFSAREEAENKKKRKKQVTGKLDNRILAGEDESLCLKKSSRMLPQRKA